MNSDVLGAELVTLSDSLTSPIPKPKTKSRVPDQGATKVVCLDSDTESDGSFAKAMVSKVALKASKDGVLDGPWDECKKQSDNWPGLQKCSNYTMGWGATHSPFLDKESELDVYETSNVIKQSDQFLNVDLGTGDSPCLSDLDAKPKTGHMDSQPLDGSANVALCSSQSSPSSLDQGYCIGNSYFYETTVFSASPCDEFRRTSVSCSMVKDVELPENCTTCVNSPISDLANGSLPAWDDQLKGIINMLGTSKMNVQVDVSAKRDYFNHERDEEDYEDHLFLKKKLRMCNTANITVNGCQNSFGGLKNSVKMSSSGAYEEDPTTIADTVECFTETVTQMYESTDTLDKETENLSKKEKQTKEKQEKEARRQQLKVEKEMLRQQKQEEKKRHQELRKQRNEEEKKRKEELKAEAIERRKVEKEKEKWEKGKFALQNITALVDTRILEEGLIGGHLLTRFAEKGFKYRLVRNPVKKTVIWQMKLPSKESRLDSQEDCLSQESQQLRTSKTLDAQLSLESVEVSYVLIVLEANEFLEMITEGAIDKHIRNLQNVYPGFTLCYLINKLMWSLQKRERKQYKTPGDNWTRPPVEQILAKLVTSYTGVHSRLCVDEAEVSDHIVGLTRSLAECPFKQKLTPLSLSANGDHVVKNNPNNDIIKKNVWLKALVALPKISGSCAIAIAKKYPSMSALFDAYLDPSKTVHEKEHLLQDLMKEGLLGADHNSRRIGPACSRRVFRILMAEQGNLHTDDVEEGADAFRD